MRYLTCSFEGQTEKATKDGRKVYRAKATSLTLDRYGEVVVPRGGVFDDFINNPVLLKSHNYAEFPIGTVVDLSVSDNELAFEFVFDTSDEEGKRAERKVKNGTLKSFSIGFIPRAYVTKDDFVDEDGNSVEKVKVKVADGEQEIDLSSFPRTPTRIFNSWELLEVSLVSVPANPAALMKSIAAEVAGDALADNTHLSDFAAAATEEVTERMLALLRNLEETISEKAASGIVEPHVTAVEEMEFDSFKALTQLAKWATEDGSGSKEKINWAKFAQGFTSFDPEAADTLTGYKGCHHTIKDGNLVAVKSAVTSTMADILNKSYGSDLEEAYKHIEAHYTALEMRAPELSPETPYTDEEIGLIRMGEPVRVPVDSDDTEGEGKDNPVTKLSPDDVIQRLATLEKSSNEKLAELAVKLEIVYEMLAELHETSLKAEVDPDEADPAETIDKGLVEALDGLLTNLDK